MAYESNYEVEVGLVVSARSKSDCRWLNGSNEKLLSTCWRQRLLYTSCLAFLEVSCFSTSRRHEFWPYLMSL